MLRTAQRTHLQDVNKDAREIVINNCRFTIYDGRTTYDAPEKGRRPLWMDSFRDLSGMVYLVDTADHQRFAESKAELDRLLAIEGLPKVPVCLLGNKTDHYNVVSEEELRALIRASGHHREGRGLVRRFEQQEDVRSIEVSNCSVTRRLAKDAGVGSVGHRLADNEGYDAALAWLSAHV